MALHSDNGRNTVFKRLKLCWFALNSRPSFVDSKRVTGLWSEFGQVYTKYSKNAMVDRFEGYKSCVSFGASLKVR